MKNKLLKYLSIAIGLIVITLLLSLFKGSDHTVDLNALNGLKYTDGSTVELQDIHGKKLVIYFWATWCSVCELNLPFFKTSYAKFQKDNVRILSIEEGEVGNSKLKEYISKKEILNPVVIGTQDTLAAMNISAFPTTIFINSKGKVKFVDTGILNPISFYIRLLLLDVF
jgi:peroxiredoxin